ncbi:MAG TPA: hypothetical protein VHC22_28180 [Pirellulales bacterium]|nr:hypothetical protein [Pirellulales bacterium]
MNVTMPTARRNWRLSLRALLFALFLAELLACWLLKTDQWRKLGLGWQLWAVVLATVVAVTFVVSHAIWLLRRRFQFGLRTLLSSVLLVGTVLGVFGIRLQQTEKQRHAAAALSAKGAGVYYVGNNEPGLLTYVGRQYFQEPIAVTFQGGMSARDLANITALTQLEQLNLCNSPLVDTDLGHFSGLRQLRHIALVRTGVTGTGLQHLGSQPNLYDLCLCQSPIDDVGLRTVSRFKNLVSLNLSQTRISDAGLAHLAGLEQLSDLYLDGTTITGQGFVHLRSLRNLEQISLDASWVGNDGMAHLQQLPRLLSLKLSNTNIDDAGLEPLCGMPGLRMLNLDGTDVTEDGLQRLRQQLPNCVIIRSSP